MNAEPAVRAIASQDALRCLERLRSDATADIRNAIPHESLQVISQARRLAWIPIEHDRHVFAAMIEVMGKAEAVECGREFLKAHLDSRLLRRGLDRAVRTFGLSPGTLIRVTPRIWPLLYRHFAFARISDLGNDSAELLLDDVHPQVLSWEPYRVMLRAFFLGYLELCEVAGDIELTIDESRHLLRLDFDWQPLQ